MTRSRLRPTPVEHVAEARVDGVDILRRDDPWGRGVVVRTIPLSDAVAAQTDGEVDALLVAAGFERTGPWRVVLTFNLKAASAQAPVRSLSPS